MGDKRKTNKESVDKGQGDTVSININSGGGDVAFDKGHIDKRSGTFITATRDASYVEESSTISITQVFEPINQLVMALPESEDKNTAQSAVRGLEAEATKGKNANENNVKKWLKCLFEIAPDIFEVTVDTLINPVKGLSTVIRKVAARAKAEWKKE